MGKLENASKRLSLTFQVNVMISKEVTAANLEEAVAIGRASDLGDLFDMDGIEYLDGGVQLYGVYETS